MPDFLDELLKLTKFGSTTQRIQFMPRRLGLGYALTTVRVAKSVIAPVRRAARAQKDAERADELRRPREESSEDVAQAKRLAKRRR